jgi:2-amino-4-hydroxy-6-hydroxymethyldihydropteridine diphosphokinase
MSAGASRRAVIALGSNLGDRLATLQRAVDGLAAHPAITVRDVSGVYETDPIGPEQPDYLNAVVVLSTALSPRELLGVAHAEERRAERVRGERWGPRTLDVDVLVVDGVTVDEPDLHVPHPRMHERLFVLVPLADVAPDLVPEDRRAEVAAGAGGVRPTRQRLRVPPGGPAEGP